MPTDSSSTDSSPTSSSLPPNTQRPMDSQLSSNLDGDRFELSFVNTEVSSIDTQVYLTTNIPNEDGAYRIQGIVRGPFSKKSQTLPATYQIADRGQGPTVLGRVHITDPCAWSRQLPSVYRTDIQIQRDGQIVYKHKAEFGIRENTWASGKSLWIGKRTVLRGVDSRRAEWSEVDEWTHHSATLLTDEPNDELCQRANDEGVIVVARLTGQDDLARRVRRLAAYPCVYVVWIDGVEIDEALIKAIDEPNILLAANIEDSTSCENTEIAVWSVSEPIPDTVRSIDKPVFAIRPLSNQTDLATARAACDQLQRDLAPELDLAGYFV